MVKTLLSLALICSTVLMTPLLVTAETTELPEVMVGQTQITFPTEPGVIIFGGMTGNESVINFEPNINLGFNRNFMVKGVSGSPPGCWDLNLSLAPATCFSLDPLTTSIKSLNSRTSIDGVEKLEVATLFYPSNVIIGDVYSDGSYLNNFSFYGRNLNQSGGSSVSGDYATWELTNYSFNSQAQSSYVGEQKSYFDNKITSLVGEGQNVTEAIVKNNHSAWYMQSQNNLSGGNTEDDIYPEGKIWSVQPGSDKVVVLRGEYRYEGKGTLIVDGNLTINSNTSILPKGDNDSLGIIVTGNVTFGGNIKLSSALFALGSIAVTNNGVDAQGSYVASGFNISNSRRYVRFRYDYKFDDNWPPGFRFFSMPTAINESM